MAFWLGNIATAVIFALAHLPAIFQMKIKVTNTILIYSNSMNIMVGLCCGWLYWTQGFAAAVLCHILFHLVWYVFEKRNKATGPYTIHLSED
ncbi:CPBP family glutamic-type intramembrane protease [Neobacillus massiliamazoniensis]|uniref:CPBP family glutamic-type intramembrane protease n=1 Tax=Neobacillus massiliamazoniensis TaxID=1499688 RepID=UPI000A634EF0|nr:CPBP family glutamic-type intramembrane protease [Neobacillus massiliamazoniensis]